MKTLSAPSILLAVAIAIAGAAPAGALPLPNPSSSPLVRHAAADCHSVGQQIARQNGGQLARATPSSQGGQTVCVIVVLVPGKDGSRPRRQEFVVPAG